MQKPVSLHFRHKINIEVEITETTGAFRNELEIHADDGKGHRFDTYAGTPARQSRTISDGHDREKTTVDR